MHPISIFLLGIAMSTDAFAAAVGKGAAMHTPCFPEALRAGVILSGVAVRVNAPFTFRPVLYSATYPAGMYVAKFQDQEGVYFPAPEQLLAQTIAGGRTMQGGLYFFKKSWSGFRAYIDEGGAIYKFDIPVPVDLTIVKFP